MNKYEKEDKYVVLNDGDPDLRPIVLSLPKAPPLHTIDGYGLEPEDQRFSRLTIPRRLIDLEAEAVYKTKEELSSNRNNVVTLLKIQKTFWELLYSRHKELKKEIAFIRRVWWHRMNGYWFFNRGKPTYITGWHFWYLNFHTMDTEDGTSRPEYRDRDRKEYIFAQYILTTTETFAKLDEDGFAIPEEDGTYKMLDTGRRICFGKQQPKNRRSGNTNKAISNMLESVSRTYKTDGGGIQSYSNDNAEEHFKMKLMPSYESYPLWLKPNTNSGRTSDELKFNVGKNDYGEKSLQTKLVYATTASEKFFDGKKMKYLLVDESGKTNQLSVLKRHDVNKNTLAQGNGRIIHGYCDYPSTVDEMADGAHDYRYMSDTSNFYCRISSSGQTFSGLFRLFIPATEGLDGYIDSYGYSVKDKILDYQREEGFTQTSNEFLQGKRDALIKKGDSESMRALREEKKLFPITYADCWLGEAGDIGFNLENIDSRLADLRRSNNVLRVNLHWRDGFGGDVYHEVDDINGRFQLSEIPPDSVSNKKILKPHFSTFEGKNVPMYRPANPGMFILGADPFRFGNKQDAKIGISKGRKSNLSDGGIAVLLRYDPSVDGDKDIREWKTHKFVLSYRHRAANTDEYNEDVLKAAIYFGAMVYPETNVPTTYEYFIRHKFGGYLLYDLDRYTGRYKDKPGIDSLERSKQDLFNQLRDYIENRSHVEDFADFLRECKDIRGMEEMRHYDRLTAHGMCLLGAKSTYTDDIKKATSSTYDFSDYLDYFVTS